MKNYHIKFLVFYLLFIGCKSHKELNKTAARENFYREQKTFETPINNYLNNNFYVLHTLNERKFTSKIDSLKYIFSSHLKKHKQKLDEKTYKDESLAIQYSFEKYILNYPLYHRNFTGNSISVSKENENRVLNNLKIINDFKNLENQYFEKYVKSYIDLSSEKLFNKKVFKGKDNQQLLSNLEIVDSIISSKKVKCYLQRDYFYKHIDNNGIKNLESLYRDFTSSCSDLVDTSNLESIYKNHVNNRKTHSIETYKKVDGFNLDIHLFFPDSTVYKGNRPTIVYFHGGSWSQGKPDYFFETAKQYAKKGWIATAVEYRTMGRHGTYPYEALKDAKTAIRWLRKNANRLNIDEKKIVATGNSAGGHLSIASVLVDNWNENSDNLNISAVPNIVMVNAAVYDLTNNSSKWITTYNSDKKLVYEISPNELIKKTDTKFLMIHGENDRNCPYKTAENFYTRMKLLQNDVELYTIKDAEHFIWFGKHSDEVEKITENYLKRKLED